MHPDSSLFSLQIMDKDIDRQINKKFLIPQPPSSNNRLKYKISQPVATKTKNNKEGSNESNIIDYKNISLSMTGKLLLQPLEYYTYIFYYQNSAKYIKERTFFS